LLESFAQRIGNFMFIFDNEYLHNGNYMRSGLKSPVILVYTPGVCY
jgi:hypothetical protein